MSQRILILRGGALGDFLVTLPALGLLRTRWPAARIELVGNARAAELGRLGGYLDAVHSQHEARWSGLYADSPLPSAFAGWLGEFDLVVNYWPDPDRVLARRFPVRPGQQYLAGDSAPAIAPAARHFCEPLRALGLTTDDFRSRLPFLGPDLRAEPADDGPPFSLADPDRDVAPVCAWRTRWSETGATGPRSRDGGTDSPGFTPPAIPHSAPGLPRASIAIHPGSGSPAKNWPAERWVELAARLEGPFLLVLGEAEREQWSGPLLDRLRSAAHSSLEIADSLALPELAAALGRCAFFLGHDSGVSHLAAALGTPCVLLFGPTEPSMWAPPGSHVQVVRRGARLDDIGVDDVVAALPQAAIGSSALASQLP